MGAKLEFYSIKETGDVLVYCGEVLTDPHKGGYDSEYKVVKSVKLELNKRYCDYELYNRDTSKYYTLEKLKDSTVEVLFGS